ncbi:MAG: ABC transporter ATP-binding protein [Alphaproteobacteria bacterium]|nr:ABC transporter ATP-binding protein [Alphaproteobacteria bacterium]
MSAGTLLRVQNLSIALPLDGRPAPILTDVSFDQDRGATLGLVGESGSGKSMTALAIMRLLPERAVTQGQVLLDGRDLLALAEPELCMLRGRRIAMIFQEPMTALNPVRTIRAQIVEGLRWHFGIGRVEAAARARAALDRVGLPAPRFPLDLYPHQLSGGQRQRVMIAMALACEPDLLIADEPTTALDVTTQAQILDLLARLVAESGMALLLITHDLGVIAENVARVLVMYAGRVVESGPTAELFRHMAHPYTRALFAASPHAAAPSGERRLAAIPGQVPDPLHRPPGCPFADRCPRVQDDCRIAPPPLLPLGPGDAPDHRAACLHPWPREVL